MKNYIGRNNTLRKKMNLHLSKLTGIETDYYSNLKNENILELKSVLSDIHNLLTLKLTIAAAKWICDYFAIEDCEFQKIAEKVDATKPNQSGFDILIREPIKLIAEVKCTSPINGGSKFGVAQRNSILDDIQKLKKGKREQLDTSDFFKFMFIIDLGDRSNEAIIDLLRQTNIRIKTEARLNRNVARETTVIFKNNIQKTSLNCNCVYLKTIKLE